MHWLLQALDAEGRRRSRGYWLVIGVLFFVNAVMSTAWPSADHRSMSAILAILCYYGAASSFFMASRYAGNGIYKAIGR